MSTLSNTLQRDAVINATRPQLVAYTRKHAREQIDALARTIASVTVAPDDAHERFIIAHLEDKNNVYVRYECTARGLEREYNDWQLDDLSLADLRAVLAAAIARDAVIEQSTRRMREELLSAL